MASTLLVRAHTGLTLTADIFPEASDTAIATGRTLTEKTNAKGWYTFTTTGTETGIHRVVIKESGTAIGVGWVRLTNGAVSEDKVESEYLAVVNLDGRVPAALTAGGNIKADVDTIKTNPVVNGGTLTFPSDATVASTTNITSGTITTTTNLTNLPSIPANWITATGITDGAFTAAKFASGAFDAVWSVATRTLTAFDASFKTGYSLAATGLDAIVSTATGMVEIAKAVWDRVLSGATHNIPASAGRRVRQLGVPPFSYDDTITGTPTSTTVELQATASATPDFYSPGLIALTGSYGTQFSRIESYNGTTKIITVATPFAVTPSSGDTAQIIPWASVRVSDVDDTPRDVIAAAANAAVEAGQVGTDAAAAASSAASANSVVSSGTHGNAALKTIIDTKASQTSVNSIPTNPMLDTEDGSSFTAITGVLDKLDTALEDDGSGGFQFTVLALDNTITAAVANKIADHSRRRTQANVEASSDGDTLNVESEYGMIQQVQKADTTSNAGQVTVFKTDGTELAQIPITTDADAEPITEIDP